MTLEEKALEYSLKINGFTKEDCYDENGELRQFIKSDIDIFLAGAKELEAENNKLLDVINNQDVKIADLEKENAELNEQNKELFHCLGNHDRDVLLINNKIVELKKQLTKAKEIIAIGLRVCDTSSIEYMNLYQKRAEQFLNGDGCPDCLCEDCTKDCPIEKIKESEE